MNQLVKAPERLLIRGRDIGLRTVISDRRTTLGIEVHPHSVEGAYLVVRSPEGLSWQELVPRIEQRANWILKQAAELDQYVPGPQPRQYLPGETFTLLGQQLQLRLLKGDKHIKKEGALLYVHLPEPSNRATVADVMSSWYHAQAKQVFHQRLEKWLKHPLLKPTPAVKLQVRKLKTRWGSLSGAGLLTLNSKLVQRPVQSIDYVIAHELCHYWHPNHGQDFLRLLTDVLPNWRNAKQRLEQV